MRLWDTNNLITSLSDRYGDSIMEWCVRFSVVACRHGLARRPEQFNLVSSTCNGDFMEWGPTSVVNSVRSAPLSRLLTVATSLYGSIVQGWSLLILLFQRCWLLPSLDLTDDGVRYLRPVYSTQSLCPASGLLSGLGLYPASGSLPSTWQCAF